MTTSGYKPTRQSKQLAGTRPTFPSSMAVVFLVLLFFAASGNPEAFPIARRQGRIGSSEVDREQSPLGGRGQVQRRGCSAVLDSEHSQSARALSMAQQRIETRGGWDGYSRLLVRRSCYILFLFLLLRIAVFPFQFVFATTTGCCCCRWCLLFLPSLLLEFLLLLLLFCYCCVLLSLRRTPTQPGPNYRPPNSNNPDRWTTFARGCTHSSRREKK